MSVERLALLLTAVFFLTDGSLAQSNCRFDAAISINFRHYLFQEQMMFHMLPNEATQSLAYHASSRITDYFPNWPGGRVTQTYSFFDPDSFSGDWPAIIGNGRYNSYLRFNDNKGVNHTGGWSGDMLNDVNSNRNCSPECRSVFFSLYEPGYLFIEGMDYGRTSYVVDIEWFWTDFKVKSESESLLHNNNPRNATFKNLKEDMTLIGVFMLNQSTCQANHVCRQPFVSIVERGGITYNCFGNITGGDNTTSDGGITNDKHCTEFSEYRITNTRSMPCLVPLARRNTWYLWLILILLIVFIVCPMIYCMCCWKSDSSLTQTRSAKCKSTKKTPPSGESGSILAELSLSPQKSDPITKPAVDDMANAAKKELASGKQEKCSAKPLTKKPAQCKQVKG